MNRLPFKLAEFAPRIMWSSAHARQIWESRISQVSNAWIQVERDSVAAGIRPSALQNCSPEQLPELIKTEAQRGLIVLPLERVAKVNGYRSATASLQANDPFDYRIAVTKPEHAAKWTLAKDDETIGQLLGTPECCRAFFKEYWGKWMDTTVPMGQGQQLNTFLRWLGVRPVSHLPCSFDCAESVEMAFKLRKLLPEPIRTWHYELLHWPTLYTSLFGVAEITNPILRMAVPTDALAEKVEIRYTGLTYPMEGASGLGFPFRQQKPMFLAVSNSKDNGFQTHAAMQEAHNVLLGALQPPYKTILDLGCGDGVLLSKIAAKRRVGVESDPRVAKLAGNRLDRVIVGDVTDHEWVAKIIAEEQPDLVIAQRDRNPLVKAPLVLYYTYEGQVSAQLTAQL